MVITKQIPLLLLNNYVKNLERRATIRRLGVVNHMTGLMLNMSKKKVSNRLLPKTMIRGIKNTQSNIARIRLEQVVVCPKIFVEDRDRDKVLAIRIESYL